MAVVNYTLNPDNPGELTKEEKKMIRKASKMPYVPDGDSPELTEDEIAEFKRIVNERKQNKQKQTVSLRLSNDVITKAKTLGPYTSILSTILSNVFKDPEGLKRYL